MEFWKLNLKEIGILKIIWELEFCKLNLRIGILGIKFERSWNFKNYLRIRVLKMKSLKKLYLEIGTLENDLKMEILKIKFENN